MNTSLGFKHAQSLAVSKLHCCDARLDQRLVKLQGVTCKVIEEEQCPTYAINTFGILCRNNYQEDALQEGRA